MFFNPMRYENCAVIMLIDKPERFFITWAETMPPKHQFMKTSTVMDETSVRQELSRMGKSNAMIEKLIGAARRSVQ